MSQIKREPREIIRKVALLSVNAEHILTRDVFDFFSNYFKNSKSRQEMFNKYKNTAIETIKSDNAARTYNIVLFGIICAGSLIAAVTAPQHERLSILTGSTIFLVLTAASIKQKRLFKRILAEKTAGQGNQPQKPASPQP